MLLTDEEAGKIKEACFICNTATAEFIVDCEITSLDDPAVKKLMKQIDHAGTLLNSATCREFLDEVLRKHELAAS